MVVIRLAAGEAMRQESGVCAAVREVMWRVARQSCKSMLMAISAVWRRWRVRRLASVYLCGFVA